MLSPAFELLFPRTPRQDAHSPVSSPVVTSAEQPVEVEFDSSNSTWPTTIYSPQQRTASASFNDESDKVDIEFPRRAWSPVDDVGSLITSSWLLVPAPSPECDPESMAPNCPVWAPGPPPYAKKAMMKSEKEECDATIDTISAFIELECTPKMQMKSVSEAMNAIGEALKIKENPTGAVRDAEYREQELMRTRRRDSAFKARRLHPELYGDADAESDGNDEEDIKPSRISRMSKVAHWIVRNDIEHSWKTRF